MTQKAQNGAFPIVEMMERLREAVAKLRVPIVTQMANQSDAPYKILVSTLISLRTKDEVTAAASARLYRLAGTPQAMLDLKAEQIAEAIYPAGFYKTKAETILAVSQRLVDEYGGRVPDGIDELLAFKGVGRKTANLVVTLGYGKPGICVDTHVHRITNRWGFVRTKTPEQTEMTLRRKLPGEYWIAINDWLVSYGQHVCKPVSPLCSRCSLTACRRIGVKTSR